MTLFFTNHEIQVYRRRQKGSAAKWGMSATGTVLPADITPRLDTRSEFEITAIGKEYVGYLDVSANIKEGDEVVIRDSSTLNAKRFSVKGVNHWEGFGNVDCREVVLVAKD